MWHFLGTFYSSLWMQHYYLKGKRKVIKDEPEKINWEQIKVITSSLRDTGL